jgi:hypothetical protein
VRFLSAVEIKEKEPRNITTADQSALKIRHVLLELEVSLQQLEAKIFKFKHEAIIYKRKNRMTEALQSFRLAKLLEEKLLERQQAHLNLIETEENIRHMYTQKEIVQAYSLATETMRNVRETLGLSVEKIDATMEEWKESLDVQKEIEDAIKVANETSLTAAAEAAGVIFDEEELEEELASLNIEQPSVAPLTVSSAETLEMPQTKSFIISAKTKLRPARPRKVIMS